MAIAIAVLQTGERVITELQEVREDNKEDGKPICLMFVRPYILNTESVNNEANQEVQVRFSKWLPCLLYTSPRPRDRQKSRMPSSA